MPVELEEIAGAPIFVLTLTNPLNSADLQAAFGTIAQVAEREERVYVVADLSEFSVDMSAIMLGFNLAMRGVPGGPGDPRTTHIVTGKDGLVRQAVEFIRGGPYRRRNVQHCATVDEGIAFARSQLG